MLIANFFIHGIPGLTGRSFSMRSIKKGDLAVFRCTLSGPPVAGNTGVVIRSEGHREQPHDDCSACQLAAIGARRSSSGAAVPSQSPENGAALDSDGSSRKTGGSSPM